MSDIISFEDFTKVDIRTGIIIEVNDFPKAKKPAYQLTIDFGKLGIKKSSAQITELYSKEDLLNKQITAVVNFKPKQIANFVSECLVLGVYNDKNEVVLLKTSTKTISGTPIN
ncbi:tRNA-binding protein [Aureibaculum sp. 2210JD6-5]|uniref:tRNA-binding protein n=1 Tax=Aureibaculum sp. 2210JD6-5 TaxID=3103957 RepID=UPI002AADD99C|nr:tRNA-binding protein [Aureibaculum sp. 2210JD6-5]MDY7395543.1 tRNA-binding protein [Aureibaculum sp. 2210JD6-5]